MTDVREAQILRALPEGVFLIQIKFIRDRPPEDEDEVEFIVGNKFDSVREERWGQNHRSIDFSGN